MTPEDLTILLFVVLGLFFVTKGIRNWDNVKHIFESIISKTASQVESMDDMICIKCKKSKGLTDYNYAGFNAKKSGTYPFPARIKDIVLPGDRRKEFLCDSCANLSKIECKVHGTITDDSFGFGKPPRCKKCDEEFESIRIGKLPKGFVWLVPLTEIRMRKTNIKKEGFLVSSTNKELYIITKDEQLALLVDSFSLSVVNENENMQVLVLNNPTADVTSCKIDFQDQSFPQKSEGKWCNFWAEKIADILDMPTAKFLWLASVDYQTVSQSEFSKINGKSKVVFCYIDEKKIITFPSLNLPSLTNLESWRADNSSSRTQVELLFNVGRIPQLVRFKQPYSSEEANPIKELKARLGLDKFDEHPDKYDLSSTFFLKGRLHSSDENQEMLIKIEGKRVFVTSLSNGKKTQFSKGYFYGDRYLLISTNNEVLTAELSKKGKEAISKIVDKPRKMFSITHGHWAVFIDSEKPQLVHSLWIAQDSFTMDEGAPVSFLNIEQVAIRNCSHDLCEIMFRWREGDESRSLKVIAPESLAYHTLETIEVRRSNARTLSTDIINLYQNYNGLKKNNLLFGLFAEIIFLNRELNKDVSVLELYEKLGDTDLESFYKNGGRLKDLTTEKILLISHFLPKIKKNFEYLTTFYPYYHLTNETNFIADAFGVDVANAIVPDERRRSIPVSRGNVQTVQSKIQRIFFEIEKAIRPIEEGIDRQKIQKSLSVKLTSNTPLIGQILLVGTMIGIGAGGGVGILAGMLGIRTLGDLLNSFNKNREEATRIKRGAETAFSWWRVLIDTLPVTIFEAGEAIDREIERCMRRDKEIIDNLLPRERKKSAAISLKNTLRKKIEEGTRNRFAEIVKDKGVRFETIASEITSSVKIDMPEKIDAFNEGLNLMPNQSG